jgi:hypothetical protein
MGLACMASAALLAIVAPASLKETVFSGALFHTVTAYPFCIKVRASAAPIAPRPITDTFSGWSFEIGFIVVFYCKNVDNGCKLSTTASPGNTGQKIPTGENFIPCLYNFQQGEEDNAYKNTENIFFKILWN